ncbi:hypothetical protein HK096_000042, partial [Nowakowskiella sp. JEL0078]
MQNLTILNEVQTNLRLSLLGVVFESGSIFAISDEFVLSLFSEDFTSQLLTAQLVSQEFPLKLISFQFISDADAVCVIFSNGEIILCTQNSLTRSFDIEV